MQDKPYDDSLVDEDPERTGLKTKLGWLGFAVLGLLVGWAAWTWVEVVLCGEPEQCGWLGLGQEQVDGASAALPGGGTAPPVAVDAVIESADAQHPIVRNVMRMKEMLAIRPEQEAKWALLESAAVEIAKFQRAARQLVEGRGFSFEEQNSVFERRSHVFANFAAAVNEVAAVLDDQQKAVIFTSRDFQ